MKNDENPTLLKPLFIKAILPIAQNEEEEKILMGALNRWRSSKGKGGIGNG